MRVLMLAHQWIPEHNAGAEVMVHAMLRALVARGHEVDITLSRQAGEPYVLDGIRVWPGRDPKTLIPGAGVLVTHLENTPVATLLGRWHRLPVVQVLHNTLDVTKRYAPAAALAVCNSEWMRANYASALGDAMPPAIVVRPPVMAADYATMPGDMVTLINLRPDETSPDGTVLGKGAELFWQLAEMLPDVKFLGVKGAYGRQMVRDLPNVEVIKHVPHHRMRDEVYSRTRVLLVPSNYESWGRVAVEAMSSGIPVIAHPTPGLTEALGSAGALVDRDDPLAWVAEIERLTCPDCRQDEAYAALRRAAELDPTDDLNRWCDTVEDLGR
jgi:hypothetical protein